MKAYFCNYCDHYYAKDYCECCERKLTAEVETEIETLNLLFEILNKNTSDD